MTNGLRTIIYPVKDIAKAKAFYGALLDVGPSVDGPHYVGFDAGDQHVGLNPNGHATGMTGPVGYWHVDDIEKSVKALLDAGAVVNEEAREVGGGRLIATVTDADGNVIGLLQDME